MPPSQRRATLIFNPHAGVTVGDGVAHAFSEFWRQRGWHVTMRPTERPGHATELARAAAQADERLVFAAGGDGTLNEVANGLVDSKTILAPLPVGTANSFAKELGIPTAGLWNRNWILEASAALASGRVQRMDLGLCDSGRYWLLWASTGADGFVIDQIEPRPRWFKRLGSAGYAAKALFFLPSFSGIEAKIVVDDRAIDGHFLMISVSNCRLYAGGELRLNPYGVLDDGQFEVWAFRGKRWPTMLRYTVEIGLANHFNFPGIELLRGRHVTVETSSPSPYHLDAEPAGRTPLGCTIQPAALRLLAPATTPSGLFQRPGQALP